MTLVNDWDDVGAGALFSDNVAHDESYARRRAAADAFTAGGPIAISAIRPDNDAAATIVCTDPTGAERAITFSLAPVLPPRIQEYELPA